MKQKGFISIIILAGVLVTALSFFFVYKSNQKAKPTNKVQTTTSNSNQNPLLIPSPVTDINTNWKSYNSRPGDPAATTDNWWNYNFKEPFSYYKYSFRYPNNWKNDSGILTDEKGDKVAEVSPGVVLLKDNQKCFDKYYVGEYTPATFELIVQEDIKLAGLSGSLKKMRITIGNNVSYEFYYCLMNNKKAFVMFFSSNKPNIDNQTLFDQILSTFKFTD